jgi:hypothetical protein
MAASCEKGIQKYYMPSTVWEDFLQNLEDEGDITDPTNALPVRIIRKGAKLTNTKYTSKVVKDRMIIPDSVVERIYEKLADLTELDKKPSGTPDEINKEYEDFFNLADLEESEEVEENEKPDCYGKYDKLKQRKRGCGDCEFEGKCSSKSSKNSKTVSFDDDEDEPSSAKDEEEIDDDLDDEDEEENPKIKNLDKLRKDLKKKSRLGKNNR